MSRKVLCLVLVLVMALPLFATLASAADAAPVEITAVWQINPEVQLTDNPVIKAIEEKLNIKLKIEAPPLNNYGDRVKMLVSTGDMPDLVHYGADIAATQWAQDGLLLDVTDLIKDYPNLSANISKEQYGDCVFLPDGRVYGIPRPNSYDKWGFLINKKWLDVVGKAAPTTIEEYVDVCRAFTNDDPDGDGQADTFGASFGASQTSLDSGIWHLRNDYLTMAYSISAWHYGMPDVDGSAKLRPLKSQYGDYVKLLREMYNEGIIDREFVTHKAEEDIEKFAQGRVGIVGASESNYTSNILEKFHLNADDYVYCAPLVLKAGDKPVYAMPPSNWMAFYVNAKSPRAADVLRLLDYLNSEEGFVLSQMGVAGLHYNTYDIETRTVDRTPEQYELRTKATSNMFAPANAYMGLQALMGGSTPEMIAKWQKESAAAEAATRKCYIPFTKMLDNIGVQCPDEVQALNSLEVRFITGEVQFDELISYIGGDYAAKTAEIAKQFADYMALNPPRFVD